MPSRILVIVNSRAGNVGPGLYDFISAIGLTGAETVVRFASQDQSLEGLTTDAAQFDRIVAVGGDGTFSTVAYETRDLHVPILAYPAGTANLLPMNLGLPSDPASLAKLALEGTAVPFDLGELILPNPRGDADHLGFAMIAGAGFDATIMQAAQPLKSTLGAAAYLLAAVSNLAPTVSDFELVLDGEHIHTSGIAVLLVNFGRIQFDLSLTQGGDPQDGKLEVVVLRSKSLAGLIPVVFAAMLERIIEGSERDPSVDVYLASEVEVSAYPPLAMQYDGDLLPTLTPCAARVLPAATTLIVGDSSPYREPVGS
ncbi:MAG: diacylglycerol kinase family protein [Coriobacteriia bacterium]|nr:diacylglycerol kinase family protein [Coriobacteriia bacterium]